MDMPPVADIVKIAIIAFLGVKAINAGLRAMGLASMTTKGS
jgi:hypothetical protein